LLIDNNKADVQRINQP